MSLDLPYAIHWFRRDLRVDGNPALMASMERCQGRVLGLFCIDSKILSRSDFSHDRFGFLLRAIQTLRDDFRSRGGDLLVVDLPPERAFPVLVERLKRAGFASPQSVSFNRDYEPFARERDARVIGLLTRQLGIEVQTEADHLLIEPSEISKEGGGYYQVYSAFARRWMEKFQSAEIRQRITLQNLPLQGRFEVRWPLALGKDPGDALERFSAENSKKIQVSLPEAGAQAARRMLQAFEPKIQDYGTARDYPAQDGTSGLSIHLKNGAITTAGILGALGLEKHPLRQSPGAAKFLSELIWREFYYHLLWHCPWVEHEAFQPQFRTIEWENSKSLFEAWKAGETGYPIVDAAMRQLHSTGLMHNRLRMIVASFLTKDLLIDWRWGESFFMERLLDGDLAANNGGWQWAASTGCDPQPYFRIFNPELQSKKFDPEGVFIRNWVPELRGLSTKEIHAPKETRWPAGYPKPVVSHASRRLLALQRYEASRSRSLKTSAS